MLRTTLRTPSHVCVMVLQLHAACRIVGPRHTKPYYAAVRNVKMFASTWVKEAEKNDGARQGRDATKRAGLSIGLSLDDEEVIESHLARDARHMIKTAKFEEHKIINDMTKFKDGLVCKKSIPLDDFDEPMMNSPQFCVFYKYACKKWRRMRRATTHLWL